MPVRRLSWESPLEILLTEEYRPPEKKSMYLKQFSKGGRNTEKYSQPLDRQNCH